MTARELADHLTQTHARHHRMVICFCGESVSKGKLDVHEKLCPVLKGDRIPVIAPPPPPPPPPPLESHQINPTEHLQNPLGPPPEKRRRISDEDMESSPNILQITANEPRKIHSLKWKSMSDIEDGPVHSEAKSHPEEGPGLDAVMFSKDSNIFTSNSPKAEEPPPKAPILRTRQPVLQKIELRRLLQQKRDEERQEKRAQEVQRRREERQIKEQQQRDQQLKEQMEPKCQDELSQLKEQQQTELPRDAGQDSEEDHEMQYENRMSVEVDSEQQASTASMEPLSANHSFGANQLRNLAYDLANLSHTIELALEQLPDQYLDDLSVELENDWAVTDMDTMLRGVLATYIHGGDEKWVNGNRWRKKPSPQPE
ncbi:hypothetical protein BDD12DRAFT_897404 [Trichophaea hybrida]|nr:hypothetical protein BDD12DRAFT_897404 [Trichophaea hybrida]